MKVQDLFDLKDNVTLVTGGSGHLGCYISEGLVEAGAKVYIASRSEIKSKEIAKILQDRTG